MNNKISLEEATLKALSKQLHENDDEEDMVNGIVDDILILKDPDLDSDDYNELIDRANEISEGTPEGELPYSKEWIDNYAIRCPICGSAFLSKDILDDESECPICKEVPESFMVLGKLASVKEDEEEKDDGEQTETSNNEEEKEPDVKINIEDTKDNIEASEVVRTSSNKLQEQTNLKEGEEVKMQEDRYDDVYVVKARNQDGKEGFMTGDEDTLDFWLIDSPFDATRFEPNEESAARFRAENSNLEFIDFVKLRNV